MSGRPRDTWVAILEAAKTCTGDLSSVIVGPFDCEADASAFLARQLGHVEKLHRPPVSSLRRSIRRQP